METESTNHQDVAEPDQIASGRAGTGQENRNTTGITRTESNRLQCNSKKSDDFFSSSGFTGTPHNSKKSDDFFSSSGFTGTPHNSKKSDEFFSSSGFLGTPQRGRNRDVIGLGVLYKGPMHAGRLPDTSYCTGKDPAEDPQERCGDRIFDCYERQERIAYRLNKKIERLEYRLTKFEERRIEEWERIE